VTKASNVNPRAAAGMMEGQAPIALVGLLGAATQAPNATDCKECGTVVAVRRSAHSVPVTFVEIQMTDGSVRTLRAPARPLFSVGDAVQVRNEALTLRDPS
jgi:hypothetical protein